MGRQDAVQFTRELAAEWQRLGARVTFEPGWETRGNGSAANYEGAIVHHTVGASSATNPLPSKNVLKNGRPGLSGPLCNSAGPWCDEGTPWIHVFSANPANHAGASGGKSMGPLPVTTAFNARVWGHEIDYLGDRPMTKGQYKAAVIVGRGVINVLDRSAEYVRAHAETSVTGKWDPGYAPGKTIDMAAFRRDVANFGGDDMAAADVKAINDFTDYRVNQLAGFVLTHFTKTNAYVGALSELVKQLAAKQGASIDMAAVEAVVERGVADAIASIETTVKFDSPPPAA